MSQYEPILRKVCFNPDYTTIVVRKSSVTLFFNFQTFFKQNDYFLDNLEFRRALFRQALLRAQSLFGSYIGLAETPRFTASDISGPLPEATISYFERLKSQLERAGCIEIKLILNRYDAAGLSNSLHDASRGIVGEVRLRKTTDNGPIMATCTDHFLIRKPSEVQS